ncbi:FecR family protein [Mucilaginibacter terrae]|uniref:FecR family protein n=1 Tax=Mucilaginibacter terrae TaxID=1955052 RepID=UPI003630E0AD
MKITPEIIEKYLNNTCSWEEKREVDDWYRSFDDNPDSLRLMNEVEQDSLKRSMYNRFKNGIAGKLNSGTQNGTNNKIYTLVCVVSGIAALLLLIFKTGVTDQPSVYSKEHNQSQKVAFSNSGFGIYKKMLPDGSLVWLSPNSTITYPQKFTGNYREVTLAGEAFFEVSKDIKHPFIISSNELTTKVWGTSFRVKAYNNLPAEVSVLTGKVSVNKNSSNAQVMLSPGEKATLVNHQQLVKNSNARVKAEMRIWKKVSLSFDNVKIKQIFPELNKNFGINIYSADPKLNDLVFTGDFTDQSLPAILDMIKESINANYSMEDERTFLFKTNN